MKKAVVFENHAYLFLFFLDHFEFIKQWNISQSKFLFSLFFKIYRVNKIMLTTIKFKVRGNYNYFVYFRI